MGNSYAWASELWLKSVAGYGAAGSYNDFGEREDMLKRLLFVVR